MRAIIIDEPGGPDQLRLGAVPDPVPGPEQVLVDIAYAGCNWADTQIRQGIYPHPVSYPCLPGREISGVVGALGENVRDVEIGQLVCALVTEGGYAERAAIDRADLILIPDGVRLDVAAAYPIQALTAFHMLHTVYRVKSGDVVLCHAVGGGVGGYVAQLAVEAGATVIGTVGTPGKEALPLRLGATRVVNTREEDFVDAVLELTEGRGADLAIDSLGGASLDRTFDAMKDLGHVINIGEAAGIPYRNLRERLLPKSLTFTRFHLRHVGMRTSRWRAGAEQVTRMIADGRLEAPIFKRFALEDAAEMHRTLEGRSAAGKLLLEISPPTGRTR